MFFSLSLSTFTTEAVRWLGVAYLSLGLGSSDHATRQQSKDVLMTQGPRATLWLSMFHPSLTSTNFQGLHGSKQVLAYLRRPLRSPDECPTLATLVWPGTKLNLSWHWKLLKSKSTILNSNDYAYLEIQKRIVSSIWVERTRDLEGWSTEYASWPDWMEVRLNVMGDEGQPAPAEYHRWATYVLHHDLLDANVPREVVSLILWLMDKREEYWLWKSN